MMHRLLWVSQVWSRLESYPVVGPTLRQMRYPVKRMFFALQPGARTHWKKRIDIVMSSPDNDFIPRVPQAGQTSNGRISMHNGVQIIAGSYYGAPITELLRLNRGVHEPQEERVFEEAVKTLPSGAIILELGAYWGFYSLSFAAAVPEARCILVEPSPSNLQYGRENFAANGRTGEFVLAYAGEVDPLDESPPPLVTVDQLCQERDIEHLDVLHADIQGSEVAMLKDAQDMLSNSRVTFVFVSTHGEDLHAAVKELLSGWGYKIQADVRPAESFSEDGLVFAVSKHSDFELPFDVSKRQQ